MSNEKLGLPKAIADPPPSIFVPPSSPAPASAAVPAPLSKPKPMPMLGESAFQLREFKQNVWTAFITKGLSVEDILARDFWGHVAAKVRVPDKIIAVAEDRAWYAELIVVSKFPTSLDVRVLHAIDLHPASTSLADAEYDIIDNGLNRGFEVVRRKDGRVLHGGGRCKMPEEAQAWLRDYLRAQRVA